MLQKIIITPNLHRIHHSSNPKELNTNFGFSISLWDLLFKSFLNTVEGGQKNFQVGLKGFRKEKDQTLSALLTQPFSNP